MSWRTRLFKCPSYQARTNLSRSHHAFLRLCVPWIYEHYFLTGVECAAYEVLCVGSVQLLPISEQMRHWLARHESGRGLIRLDTRGLYAEYHAARLMRMYLRYIVKRETDSVVTGGYVTSMYLASMKPISWRPGDIDIFTATDDAFTNAMTTFRERVGDPLGLNFGERIAYVYPDNETVPAKQSQTAMRKTVSVWKLASKSKLPHGLRRLPAKTGHSRT